MKWKLPSNTQKPKRLRRLREPDGLREERSAEAPPKKRKKETRLRAAEVGRPAIRLRLRLLLAIGVLARDPVSPERPRAEKKKARGEKTDKTKREKRREREEEEEEKNNDVGDPPAVVHRPLKDDFPLGNGLCALPC